MTFLAYDFKLQFLVFLTSITVDLIIGEWPMFMHPVVWMGKIVSLFDRKSEFQALRFILGFLLFCFNLLLWGYLGLFVNSLHNPLGFILSVYLFKSTFSIKSLYKHVKDCKKNDLNQMKNNVGKIVSRDISTLNRPQLISASLESLSENTNDSIVAPLFYYAFFGLSFALIYRTVNTLDAMVGYRNKQYEWFGKPSARVDDILNFIPSRLTALIFSIFSPTKAFQSMKKYAHVKINATFPMSAFCGVLGVCFEKIGYYKFDGKTTTLSDIDRGLKLFKKSVVVIIIMFSFITWIK